MQLLRTFASWLFPVLLVVGCASPKFIYEVSPQKLNPSGPTIVVMPLIDERTNRAMDKVLEQNYMADVQGAIATELAGMGLFKSALIITNASASLEADIRLKAFVRRLEWEIPNYGKLRGEAFMVGFFTGIVGGSIYLNTGIDVYGHSDFLMQAESRISAKILLNKEYSASVTNRLKKGSCDLPKTKALMMSASLKEMMGQFKPDLESTSTSNNP